MKHLLVLMVSPFVLACVGDSTVIPTEAGLDGTTNDVATDSNPTDANPQDVAQEAEAGPFDGNFFGNLELWLSADHGVTASSGNVTAWSDRSIKARNVTPSNNGACTGDPTVVASAIHGLPAVKFDGSTQCFDVSGTFSDFTSGFTGFVVLQPGNCNSQFLGSNGGIFDSYDNSQFTYTSGIAIHRNYNESAQNATGDGMLSIYDLGGSGDVGLTGGGTWVPATPVLLTFRLPAAAGGALESGTAYVNGTFEPNLSPNNPFSPDVASRTTTYIGRYDGPNGGGYHLYCGMLAEMLIYSKALADADRGTVETYLRGRWGL